MKRICVYCGSSPGKNPAYTQAAKSLAKELCDRDIGLVFGGGAVGVMGVVADAVIEGGGEVIGVIPKALAVKEVAHYGLSELHVVASMHERKAMMAELEALPFDELMETLKKRLEEQEKRHEGGNKWIGTGGTSPFGAYGYNPEGVRIGQKESRHQRAVKVWDKREFKNLDGDVELGTRNIKVALKRLRRWVREGAREELDLDGTIRTANANFCATE